MSLKGILSSLEPSQVEEWVQKVQNLLTREEILKLTNQSGDSSGTLNVKEEVLKLISQFDSPSDILSMINSKIEGGNPDGIKELVSRLYPDGLDASEKEALNQFDRLSHEDSQLSEMIEGATETVSEAVVSDVPETGELLSTVAEAGGELLSTVGEASGELLSTIAEFLSSL